MVKIKDKSKCVGCGACFQICSHRVLNMRSDEEGFLYPVVESTLACVNCGLCERVCPISNSIVPSDDVLNVYVGYAKDENVALQGGCLAFLQKKSLFMGEWFLERL